MGGVMGGTGNAGGGSLGGPGEAGNIWEKTYKQTMGTTGNILGGLSSYSESRRSAAHAKARKRNALQEGRNNMFLQRRQAARDASAKTAWYGASGVDVNVGSPVNVMAGIEADGEVSALQALYAGEMEAANWEIRRRTAKQRGGTALLGTGLNFADPLNWGGGRDALWGNYLGSGGGTYMGAR